MSPLLPDSAILLQIYSHPYNTTSARLVQLLAGPRGKPDQGTDAGEQKIAWWGKKKKKVRTGFQSSSPHGLTNSPTSTRWERGDGKRPERQGFC